MAYCPERIAQGFAIKELSELPQLVAGLSDKALQDSLDLFARVAPKVLPVSMEEAELAKLFANAWRYIQFAVSNQFCMIARNFGVDFNQVRAVLMQGYGRAATLRASRVLLRFSQLHSLGATVRSLNRLRTSSCRLSNPF